MTSSSQSSPPLEAAVTHSICLQLENLGWVVDEQHPDNNVTQQRVRTNAQRDQLRKANEGVLTHPDFVLYENGTNRPIAIIEAKRPGHRLDLALDQATTRYAIPLNAPLIFAYNNTFVATRYLRNGHPLKIDGEDVRQFIDHFTSLRFVNEGSEILSAPASLQISRDQLIRVFKRQANLLREAGLQAGLERFSAFSDVLFLKLIDEFCQLREHAGDQPPIPPHLRWSQFIDMRPVDRLVYVRDVVWREINARYGPVFGATFPIESPEIFDDIVTGLASLNFTGTDADIKGDAFEFFLKNAYQGITIKDLGEYFTPRNIVRTMVSMVDPVIGESVYDPFCGTGGFLIEAFRYIQLRTKVTGELKGILENDTVFGSEISETARVARMNMILYGDGHSNVEKRDSFANPEHGKYDVVLTNPPYSQKTRHGNLYPVPSRNGDAIAMQHCIKALKPDGRAAILVKEDFLSEMGDIGLVREMLTNEVHDISVVSLPRRLFEPYTPTKTSILFFRKRSSHKRVSFYIVRRVGHEFGAKKRTLLENDLPAVMSAFQRPGDDANDLENIEHLEVPNAEIYMTNSSLWMFDYKEALPPVADSSKLVPLRGLIRPSGRKFAPSKHPEETFRILGVSNTRGIFFNELKLGSEIKQNYIRVQGGDLVYNPHRVNVGSIGLVPSELDGGIISGIYVVFRPVDERCLPAGYLLRLLKSDPYQFIIQSYDSKHGAVRANLNWEQLTRIRIEVPDEDRVRQFQTRLNAINGARRQLDEMEDELRAFVSSVNR